MKALKEIKNTLNYKDDCTCTDCKNLRLINKEILELEESNKKFKQDSITLKAVELAWEECVELDYDKDLEHKWTVYKDMPNGRSSYIPILEWYSDQQKEGN